MPNIVSVASAAPVKSSSTPSSAGSRGMVCVASVRPLSQSCSPTLIRSTSPSMRLTRTTRALRTGLRPHRPVTTNMPRAYLLSVTRTSVSMRSGGHKCIPGVFHSAAAILAIHVLRWPFLLSVRSGRLRLSISNESIVRASSFLDPSSFVGPLQSFLVSQFGSLVAMSVQGAHVYQRM